MHGMRWRRQGPRVDRGRHAPLQANLFAYRLYPLPRRRCHPHPARFVRAQGARAAPRRRPRPALCLDSRRAGWTTVSQVAHALVAGCYLSAALVQFACATGVRFGAVTAVCQLYDYALGFVLMGLLFVLAAPGFVDQLQVRLSGGRGLGTADTHRASAPRAGESPLQRSLQPWPSLRRPPREHPPKGRLDLQGAARQARHHHAMHLPARPARHRLPESHHRSKSHMRSSCARPFGRLNQATGGARLSSCFKILACRRARVDARSKITGSVGPRQSQL